MPLLLHGAEVILVLDPDPTPGTKRWLSLASLARLNLKEEQVRLSLAGVRFLVSY